MIEVNIASWIPSPAAKHETKFGVELSSNLEWIDLPPADTERQALLNAQEELRKALQKVQHKLGLL